MSVFESDRSLQFREVGKTFAELLQTRFEKEVLTSEHDIRQTLCAALLKIGVRPEHIILEYYSSVIGGNIDVLIRWDGMDYIVEIKYDSERRGARGKSNAKRIANIVQDLYRLYTLSNNENQCIFVYVAQGNKVWQLFDVGFERIISLGDDPIRIDRDELYTLPYELRKEIDEEALSEINAYVSDMYSCEIDIPNYHFVRVLRVE